MLFMAQTHCWLCHCASHKMFCKVYTLTFAIETLSLELTAQAEVRF